jgi:hypothetical protein
LRHLHLESGVAIVGFTLVLAAPPSVLRTIGMLLAALIAVLVPVGLGRDELLRRTDIPGSDTAEPSMMAKARNIGWILLIWLPVLVLVGIGFALPHAADGPMGGYDQLVTAWFAGQSVLTLGMLAVIAVMAAKEQPRLPRRAAAGLGTIVLTILALYLGAALTSGFVILSAAWITSSTPWIGIGDVEALLRPDSAITIPGALQYAGLGTFAVALVVLAAIVLTALYVLWIWGRGGTRADRRHADKAESDARTQDPQQFARHRPGTVKRRKKSVSRSVWLARRVDLLPGYLAVLVISIGVIGAVLTIVIGYRVVVGGIGLDGFGEFRLWSFMGGGTVNPVAIGVWLIVGLLITLVVLGALAFRVPKTRKSVGILWDIGSFWPRDVHPLAPPCYAERAVPELAMRLGAHVAMVAGTERSGPGIDSLVQPAPGAGAPNTGGTGTVVVQEVVQNDAWTDGAVVPGAGPAGTPGLVVLAAHSQGTVISMATLLGPGRLAADRTALLTFGTVLRRLYARFFPLYFSDDAFAAVSRRLGESGTGTGPWTGQLLGLATPALRWRNLWRRTDYLGGRLGDPLVDDAPPAAGPDGLVQIDVEFVDPLFLPGRGDSVMPAAGRHSNFPRDPEFQAQLMSLVRAAFTALDPSSAPSPPEPPAPTARPDDLMNPRESMV